MRSRKNRSRPPREDGLLTAAFYGRVSSNLQKVEESIEQQREQCYRWAEQNGYRIVEEFIDQAVSGTREDRPEFNEMVAKALSNGMPFDAIIVWNSARMARNTIYAMVTKKQLDDHGVKFHMLNVPIDEDDEEVAALVYPMIHAMDEVHSIRTGNEVRRAQRARAEKGDWGGSNPPLGYKVQKETKNGRTSRILVIDPEWAWLVKRMYEDYDSGIAVNRLRIQWDSEGIRTPKGKFWANTTITNILKSEVNKGTLVRGLKSNKRKKLDPVRFEEAFDPIVSKELWDRIQQKMADRAPHKPRETVRNHPLTGLLRCAKCGGRMDPDGKSPEKSYYYCINRRKPEPYRCDARGIPMAQAERKAIEGVTSILTPEHIEELIATLESETEEARRQQGQNLERIERHLEKNQHEKSNLLRFVRQNDNIDDSVIASELVDLQRQHKQLVESKICEEIELNKRTRVPNARDQIKAYVGKLRMGISIDDPSKVREVLKTFCDHITGEKDKHLTIYYNIPLPPEEFGPRERRQQVSLHDPSPSFDLPSDRELTRPPCFSQAS
jgi:DNA invertase Pin-like site-specific DNA recombinase